METFVLCKILAMKSFDLKATLFCLLFQFREFTDQDITKNYPHKDNLVNAGRVALALTLLLSFPLLIFPCRAVINKVRNMLDFFLLTKSLVDAEEVTEENLVSYELIAVKFPPKEDNESDDSKVSHSSERQTKDEFTEDTVTFYLTFWKWATGLKKKTKQNNILKALFFLFICYLFIFIFRLLAYLAH